MSKHCKLEDRLCNNCGECKFCDINKNKICDNCCNCLGDSDYSGIKIDEVVVDYEDICNC